MTESRQLQEPEQLTRYGKPVYETNPSVTGRLPTRIVSSAPKKGGTAYMIASDTGEVVGRGAFGFIEETEVDAEQFVKVYLAGIKQYAQLSKAGAMMFEYVYREISGRAGKDKDTVNLNYILAKRFEPTLARRTYERGMNELLDKEFLYRSIAADTYFVNVRFMFNGDRMVLAKAYRRKGAPPPQAELPLEPMTIEGEAR